MNRRTRKLAISTLAVVGCGFLPGMVHSHEYWIEPHRFQLEPGIEATGDLKNGMDFRGSRYSYITRNFDFFTITGPDGTRPVTGRDGDMPALVASLNEPGLYSVSYQGKFDKITFSDPEKIDLYIEYEGLIGIRERHAARGLPPDRFQEHYARCAKALIQAGEPDEQGRMDSLTGMKFELVAEKNPYTLSENDTLPVRLYWEGQPSGDVQIRWFRFDTESETGTVRTDADGRAMIPLAGGGKFLINAVKLLEGDEDTETEIPEWYSYWASMTFGIKGTDEALAGAK